MLVTDHIKHHKEVSANKEFKYIRAMVLVSGFRLSWSLTVRYPEESCMYIYFLNYLLAIINEKLYKINLKHQICIQYFKYFIHYIIRFCTKSSRIKYWFMMCLRHQPNLILLCINSTFLLRIKDFSY